MLRIGENSFNPPATFEVLFSENAEVVYPNITSAICMEDKTLYLEGDGQSYTIRPVYWSVTVRSYNKESDNE